MHEANQGSGAPEVPAEDTPGPPPEPWREPVPGPGLPPAPWSGVPPGPPARRSEPAPWSETGSVSPAPWSETTPTPPAAAAPSGPPPGQRGLRVWTVLVAGVGIGALAIGQAELAALAAVAGLFAVAQAADLNPRFQLLHTLVAWVVPLGGAATFATLAMDLGQADRPGPTRGLAVAVAILGGLASLVTLAGPLARALASTLFRVRPASHTLALASRLFLFGLLLCVPGHFGFESVFGTDALPVESLLGAGSLWAGLMGFGLLALGGVGFLVRRDAKSTLERLGLRPLRPAHLVVIALGVAALFTLNSGAESLERTRFPALWESDQRVNRMLVSGLGRGETLLLGLSAGIGEEVALRGALQPRLGLVPTSVLFAALHVQYSWLGMAVILLLGMLLGWIRRRTSTTVAIAVHALYDILAVVTTPPIGS